MSDLPTVSLPGFTGETTLPPELLKNSSAMDLIKKGVTQWSRIAAWSWCDYLVYAAQDGTCQNENCKDEEKLKKILKLALKEQAKNSEAYISYGDSESKEIANVYSLVIIFLLVSDNTAAAKALSQIMTFLEFKSILGYQESTDEVPEEYGELAEALDQLDQVLEKHIKLKLANALVTLPAKDKVLVDKLKALAQEYKLIEPLIEDEALLEKLKALAKEANEQRFIKFFPKVTLSDLIMTVTKEPLVTSVPENRAFVELFEVQVITSGFSGKVVYAAKGSQRPYISIIAYPACPEIFAKDSTVLKDWASDKNKDGNYLPPSVYIPIAVS